MQAKPTSLASGARRAALAFSVLPTPYADAIAHRLTMHDRVRLREGLAQVRDAADGERIAALHDLVRAIRNGIDWPVPIAHNETDCPFRCINRHPEERVAAVLEQLAARQPLTVAVTLCHLPNDKRDAVWHSLGSDARAHVSAELSGAAVVGVVRTRILARELENRLVRAAKVAATRPTT